MKKVLFICMGNICRSPMAEGILLDKIAKHGLPIRVNSAGTHGYHVNEQYDVRTREELRQHGINIDHLHSRRITKADFDNFDVIFAADHHNLNTLRAEFGELADKVWLMSKFSATYHNEDIPDPYYGGKEGFATIYQMLDECIDAWLIREGYLR